MTTVVTQLDPTGHFTKEGVSGRRIFEALGLIPNFLNDPSNEDYEDIRDRFEKHYPFGLFEIQGGELNKDKYFCYPADPDLPPLVMYQIGDQKCYQYEHAIIAIEYPDSSVFVTRMD